MQSSTDQSHSVYFQKEVSPPKTTNLKSYKRGTYLQLKGDAIKRIFFVKEGVLRSFDTGKNGREFIFMFATKGSLMYDHSSLATRPGTSQLYIDVIEDCIVESINPDLFRANASSPDCDQDLLLNMQQSLSQMQERILMMMRSSIYERYEHFLDTYSHICNRIPQKMIASYLGITPEAFSNIKAKYYKSQKLLRSA